MSTYTQLAVKSFSVANTCFRAKKYKATFMALHLSLWLLLGCPKWMGHFDNQGLPLLRCKFPVSFWCSLWYKLWHKEGD